MDRKPTEKKEKDPAERTETSAQMSDVPALKDLKPEAQEVIIRILRDVAMRRLKKNKKDERY